MSKVIDLEKFDSILPSEIKDFITLLSEWGFGLTLVGGAVRDFVLYGTLSSDLDFEVRSYTHIEDSEWEHLFQKLSLRISKLEKIEVQKLKFNIIRIKLPTIELEISSPRVEIYDDDKKGFGHSDFKVKFSSNYSHIESFRRRDFSINAMGIEWGRKGELNFIDPFGGLEAITNRELDYITDDFFNDPVRFLRVLRFKVAHGLTLSRRLKDNIIYFNLDKLSLHYFIQEGRKIGIEKLIYEMEFSRRKFSTKLPPWASLFNKVETDNFSRCDNLVDLLLNYSVQENVSDEDLILLGREFSVKQVTIKKIITIRRFKNFELSRFKEYIKKMKFEKVIMDKTFLDISKLFKSIESIEDQVLSFYFSQSDIMFFKAPIIKDELYKNILPTISRDQISMLGIYCHILKS